MALLCIATVLVTLAPRVNIFQRPRFSRNFSLQVKICGFACVPLAIVLAWVRTWFSDWEAFLLPDEADCGLASTCELHIRKRHSTVNTMRRKLQKGITLLLLQNVYSCHFVLGRAFNIHVFLINLVIKWELCKSVIWRTIRPAINQCPQLTQICAPIFHSAPTYDFSHKIGHD